MYKILIIEDDSLTFRLAKLHLAKAGYEVVHAENGRLGVQLFESYKPDLIFCDIMMPEMNGYEVLQWVRRHPEGKLTPFIFLSSKTDRTDVRHGMNLGADDYLMKPLSSEEMLETIRIRLERRQAIAPVAEPEETVLGLPGQKDFQAQLQSAIQECKPDGCVGVLRLVLDHFDTVKNALGRECERHILKLQAGKLIEVTELAGSMFYRGLSVFYWGLGEFVILLPKLAKARDLTAMATHLLQATRSTIAWKNYELYITASIGTAVFPSDSRDPDELSRYAELAMQSAIEEGRNLVCAYKPSLRENAVDRLLLEHSLRHALEAGLFQLYYQPQMDLASNRLAGAEALIRWIDLKAKKIVFPMHFIPLAEKTGLLGPLTEWVLTTGCAQAHRWNQTILPDFRISLNLSSQQLREKNFLATFSAILRAAKVAPASITLEISESFLMLKTEPILPILQQIKDLGVSIAIDDFGTGYSSMGYLKDFPIDAVKIEQCFVRDITESKDARALTQTIIAMAHDLGIKVVAEGVETLEQLDVLQSQGCDVVQGYLLSKPMPAKAFEEFLEARGGDFGIA